MARLFLEMGQTFGNVGGFSNTDVIGTNGDEKVFVANDGKATFDPSFNRGGDQIVILGSSEVYSGARSGSALLITSTNGAVIRIPIGTVGTTITFNDGSVELLVSDNVVKLGAQEITTTPDTLDSLFIAPPAAAEAHTPEAVVETHAAQSPPPVFDMSLVAHLTYFG